MKPFRPMTMLRSLTLLLAGAVLPVAGWAAEGMVQIKSQHDVAETEARLLTALQEKGFTVMAQVDHAKGARSVDLELEPTRLVIFGNPAGGTRL
ncbi:MAG: DUF302 domain-containing protein, partial [Guyparkeria sp.]